MNVFPASPALESEGLPAMLAEMFVLLILHAWRYLCLLWGVQNADTEWKNYEFKCKPTSLDRAPCFLGPYHHRLDWQMVSSRQHSTRQRSGAHVEARNRKIY